MKIAITSMYANPLHPGHVECMELSKELADMLVVIINNDHQARLKRGTESFQDEQYRLKLVHSLKPVDRTVLSVDTDATVCKTLEETIKALLAEFPGAEIVFTKGGDRFANEIPEKKVCDAFNVRIIDGLGAKTHNSSSYIHRVSNPHDAARLTQALEHIPENLKEQKYIEVGYRPWGVYYVLEDQPKFKVKKIIVSPGHRLSLQSHKQRSEHWVVVSGTATVHLTAPEYTTHSEPLFLQHNESCTIPQGHIHRLSNEASEHLVVIEVQCGAYTGEDDIVRYHDDYARS